MDVVWKPVVNFTEGRAGYKSEAIVIHIGEGTLEGGYAWFNNPASGVSAHYMIGKEGEKWQFVKDENTAWHAGGINKPSWPLLKPGVNPNLYTIGIEHEGWTGEEWTQKMKDSSAELIAHLCQKYSITLDNVHIIGHYMINSVSRINCPGKGVDIENDLINPAKAQINSRYIPSEDTMVKVYEIMISSREDLKNLTYEEFKTWWPNFGRPESIEKLEYLMRIDVFVNSELKMIPIEEWIINAMESDYRNKKDLIYATEVFYSQPDIFIEALPEELQFRTFWYVVMPDSEVETLKFKSKPYLNNLIKLLS